MVGTGSIALLALAALAVYAFACWAWPYMKCRRCKGAKVRVSPGGKAFGLCRKCGGSGSRLRFGRWLYEHCTE
jgi:hypothetical protein